MRTYHAAQLSLVTISALFLLSDFAADESASRHYLEDSHSAPAAGWKFVSEVLEEEHLLNVVIAVRHTNSELIEKALREVSDPRSPKYGQYYALDERWSELLGTRENAQLLVRWLEEEGGVKDAKQTIAGDFVQVRLSASVAKRLFRVSLGRFRHQASGHMQVGMLPMQRYSVPAALASTLDFVRGLHLPRLPESRPSLRKMALHWPHGGDQPGSSDIVAVEARDKAFQVHINVLVSHDLVNLVCQGACSLQDFSTIRAFLRGFDVVATPIRLGVQWLPAAEIFGRVEDGACVGTNSSVPHTSLLVCTVVVGPDLRLVNFNPTNLRMRARFSDNSTGNWTEYRMSAYPASAMTIIDLRTMYNVPDGSKNRHPNNSQALASFFNISTNESDAQKFHLAMGTRRQPNVTFVGRRGEPGVEGNIDLQWIQAMGNQVPTTYWETPGGDESHAHEPFLEWILALANSSHPPLVHSMSYGENEYDYVLTYQMRGNTELMKLGLRGVTILVATGDTGVQGAAQQGGTPPRCEPFAPVWPASSPYVTAVGGTMNSNHGSEVCSIDKVYAMDTESAMPFVCPEQNLAEIVCSVEQGSIITSGGGFSERFSMPSYQEEAVEEYLMQINVTRSLFNPKGRAYPDISALGQNMPIYFKGQLVMVGGTSSSAPVVAGLLSLINSERLEAGLPSLGFFNPLLYLTYERWPSIVNDVRVGNNAGSNLLLPPAQVRTCLEGFSALPGWDAASGLGTPNFHEMTLRFLPSDVRSIVTSRFEQTFV